MKSRPHPEDLRKRAMDSKMAVFYADSNSGMTPGKCNGADVSIQNFWEAYGPNGYSVACVVVETENWSEGPLLVEPPFTDKWGYDTALRAPGEICYALAANIRDLVLGNATVVLESPEQAAEGE